MSMKSAKAGSEPSAASSAGVAGNTVTGPPASAHPKSRAIFVSVVGSLAGLMFGLDIGVIAGATMFIQRDFAVSNRTIEHIVSWMMLGATAGALISGRLSSRLGRKRSLIGSSLLFTLASIVCGLSNSVSMLLIGRLILGVSIGVLSFTAPLYLAEVAPKQNRGAMVSLYQMMIDIGILLAFFSDTMFSYSGNWHWMLGIVAIPGVLFAVGMLALPDSPRWLMMAGKKEQALRVLGKLRHDPEVVQREAADIEETLRTPQRGWSMFRENRNFRRSVGLGVLLQIMQQITGMNVMMYYAPRVFGKVGLGLHAAMWGTVSVGLTNVVFTLIAIVFVDRWGRKPILYAGFLIMAVGQGTVGLMMHLGISTYAEEMFTVAMLLVFIMGFAISAGPILWTLCSEIQPLKGRDFGMSATVCANWIGNFFVGATFLTLLKEFGDANTFWLYAGFNLLSFVFTLWLVPETRGVTLEQIEHNLMSGKALRRIGR